MTIEGSGVYVLRHDPTQRTYVGSAVHLPSRLQYHRDCMRSGIHHNSRIAEIFNGGDGHEFSFGVLEYCERHQTLGTELRWIKEVAPSLNLRLDDPPDANAAPDKVPAFVQFMPLAGVPNVATLQLVVDRTLAVRFRAMCMERGTSASAVISRWMQDALDRGELPSTPLRKSTPPKPARQPVQDAGKTPAPKRHKPPKR